MKNIIQYKTSILKYITSKIAYYYVEKNYRNEILF
jgi:hypothetical protein